MKHLTRLFQGLLAAAVVGVLIGATIGILLLINYALSTGQYIYLMPILFVLAYGIGCSVEGSAADTQSEEEKHREIADLLTKIAEVRKELKDKANSLKSETPTTLSTGVELGAWAHPAGNSLPPLAPKELLDAEARCPDVKFVQSCREFFNARGFLSGAQCQALTYAGTKNRRHNQANGYDPEDPEQG